MRKFAIVKTCIDILTFVPKSSSLLLFFSLVSLIELFFSYAVCISVCFFATTYRPMWWIKMIITLPMLWTHQMLMSSRDTLISSGRPKRAASTTTQSLFPESSRISWKEIMIWIYRLMWPSSRSRVRFAFAFVPQPCCCRREKQNSVVFQRTNPRTERPLSLKTRKQKSYSGGNCETRQNIRLNWHI